MTVGQRLGAVVVAAFAVVFTRAPWLIRVMGPVMMRQLAAPSSGGGPNVLLTVRRRRSGRPRTVPVAYLDLGDRGFVQANSQKVDWVRNLRASRQAMITRRGRTEMFEAVELSPETAGSILDELLTPFPRSRLIRAVVGPVDRPPVGVLHYFRLRVDGSVADHVRTARRQPVFELRRRAAAERPDAAVPGSIANDEEDTL